MDWGGREQVPSILEMSGFKEPHELPRTQVWKESG